MYDVTTITKSAWESLLRKEDSGNHVVLRNVQRYSPVSAEYVPKSPDGLMPTLHRGYHGPGKCITLVPYALLYFIVEVVVRLGSFPGSYSLVSQTFEAATDIRGVD